MRKSIATVSVSGTLPQKLDAIAAARFAAIELFDADLVCSSLSPEQVAQRCTDLGLAIDLYQPLRDIVGLDPVAFPDRLRFARAKFDIMERLGASRVLVCSAVHPQATPDLDLAAEQLGVLGEAAADHGVSIAFEALAWGTQLNRVRQAWTVVERADRANVGLALDTFHILARGDDATALAGIPGDRMEFLQIADAPYLSMDVLEWSRHHRCFPGQGALDVLGVVAAVVEAGYRGPLSLEVFSDVVREADPRATARDAMRSLLFLEEQLRVRWTEGDAPARARPVVELFDPPPEPTELEMSFVEVSADPRTTGVTDLLSSLGFVDAGADSTASLRWWRNGQAHVLLNTASDLTMRRSAAIARPAVTALGIAVEDPHQLTARAEALNWVVAEQRSGVAAPVLASTTSPVGVTVQISGLEGGRHCWQEAFARTVRLAPEAVALDGWGGLDHVGAVVDIDRSDAEVSFYRTLLGLRPGPVSEFIDPVGRLRSRVMQAENTGARVVLNIAVRGDTAAETGVNQLAFHCSGLLDRVELLRAVGVPLLAIPDGYYDDLSARLDPPAGLLARMRRLGVLYDRVGAGELFHVYTPLVAGRFYVELLERRGGYDGFGSTNTPVRLALQASTPWIG